MLLLPTSCYFLLPGAFLLSLSLAAILRPALPLRARLLTGFLVGIMAATLATLIVLSEPLRPQTRFTNGVVTGLIFREGYVSQTATGPVDHTDRWYLRIGSKQPDAVATSIAPFKTSGDDAVYTPFPNTPGETARASIKDLEPAPQQICTGDCDGLAAIDDDHMRTTPGIIEGDWQRLQKTTIGQTALGEMATGQWDRDDPTPAFWLLDFGLSAAIVFTVILLLDWRNKSKNRSIRRPAAKSGTNILLEQASSVRRK